MKKGVFLECWWAAAQCKSYVDPDSENSKPCPGEHKNQHRQPVKRSGCPVLFSVCVVSLLVVSHNLSRM